MPMPRHKLTARGRASRDRILEAAEPVFAARGFYGANVRELADAAGMPTASLLHHFPTKEKLYAAVLAEVAAELDTLFDGALELDRSHAERLETVVDIYLDWCAASPGRSNLLLRELLDNPPRLADDTHMVLAPLVDRLSRFARAGQRAGAFREIAPIIFITHLVGGAAYFAAARPTFERIGGERRNLSARWRRELAPLILDALVIK